MSQPQFESFVQNFRNTLRSILNEHPEVETVNHLEGLPREILDKILEPVPLSVFIPTEYGGMGDHPSQCLALLEAISYESIALGLAMGINGSLFLEPVAKYGHEEAKKHVFEQFLNHKKLGGLMITEPEVGTDALNMQTCYQEQDPGFSLKGSKHWGGLTGLADFWLVTARKDKGGGKLSRDIDLFICEKSKPEQRIEVEDYYHKLGLFLIPYGLNKMDLQLPESARLIPQSSGVKLMMDLLHRSRLRLSGIGIGFIKRMLDEALEHCRKRFVGGKSLLAYDQVAHRLSELQAWHTVNSALCFYATRVSDVSNDLTSYGLQANASKAILTDMMQESAQSLLQLVGAKGYRRDHIAGRAIVDSRPFQIFEGSNDVMYSQIADAVIKEMKKLKETNFLSFLKGFQLTEKAGDYFKKLLDFKVDPDLIQRKRVLLGKVAARLITSEFVLEMGNAGFRKDLIDNALEIVNHTIAGLLSSFSNMRLIPVVEDARDKGDWKKVYPN